MTRRIFSFILNLPWTAIGALFALASLPEKIWIDGSRGIAIVVKVRYLWWLWMFDFYRSAKAATIGNVIVISNQATYVILEHECIHVTQYDRYPLVFPFVYACELFRRGYFKNRFEIEAYTESERACTRDSLEVPKRAA